MNNFTITAIIPLKNQLELVNEFGNVLYITPHEPVSEFTVGQILIMERRSK